MKLEELEASLSPVRSHSRSVSAVNKLSHVVPSFTIDIENEFISKSAISANRRDPSRTKSRLSRGISHRSISRHRQASPQFGPSRRGPARSAKKIRPSPRNAHREFFERKQTLMVNRNRQQKMYETKLKRRSEKSKISANSKLLLERIKVKRLEQAIERETDDQLDFGGVGRVIDRVGLFEYLRLGQEEGKFNSSGLGHFETRGKRSLP